MKTQKFKWEWAGGVLAGTVTGTGPKLVLCLHGYGNDRSLWAPFVNDFPDSYTFVVPDLPLFGESTWLPDHPIGEEHLCEIRELLARHLEFEELHLLCFSLGAKFGLGLVQASPEGFRSATLLAPDGLKIHPMYAFCIYNPVGRWLFRRTIRKPGFFLFVLGALYKLKLADAFKFRFVKGQFDSPAKRELLKRVWFGYAGIRVDRRRLLDIARGQPVQWHVLWGRYDNIHPVKIGKDFVQFMPDAQLHLVEGGHLLLKKHPERVKSILKKIYV